MKKQRFRAIAVLLWLLLINLSLSVAQTIPQPQGDFIPLLRYYNLSSKKHIYTTNHNEFGTGNPPNFVYEGLVGWLKGSPNLPPNNEALKRFRRPSTGSYLLAFDNVAPPGWILEGNIGWKVPTPYGTIPVYEYYNATTKDYFYTTINGAYSGYVYNGIAFSVMP